MRRKDPLEPRLRILTRESTLALERTSIVLKQHYVSRETEVIGLKAIVFERWRHLLLPDDDNYSSHDPRCL